MDSMPKVSIVIPVYNGEKTIGPLVGELIASLGPSYQLEIVLVNDCSADRSEQACIALFERHPDIVRVYSRLCSALDGQRRWFGGSPDNGNHGDRRNDRCQRDWNLLRAGNLLYGREVVQGQQRARDGSAAGCAFPRGRRLRRRTRPPLIRSPRVRSEFCCVAIRMT